MRNIVMFALIFIPIVAVVLAVYISLFKKKALPPEPVKVPSRHDLLVEARLELATKLTELHDAKEICDLKARIAEVDHQLQEPK